MNIINLRSGTVWLVFGLWMAVLSLWEFVAGASSRSRFLFSKPSDILSAFWEGLFSGPLLTDSAASISTTLIGVLLGLTIAVFIMVLTLRRRQLLTIVELTVVALATLPILAIAPLFLVWFGTGLELKVAISAFMVSVLVFRELSLARSEIDKKWLPFKDANDAKPSVYIRTILTPQLVAFLIRRVPEIVNVSFLGTFIGEFIAADRGLGYRVLRSSSLYQVDLVFATALLSVIVLVLMQIFLVWTGHFSLPKLQTMSISMPHLRSMRK